MNRIKIRIPALLALLMSAIMLSSCSKTPSHDIQSMQSRKELDSLRNIYRSYNIDGLYDSIIHTANPYLLKAISADDTLAVLYSGAYIAQAFLTLENIDSVRSYMNLIEPYRTGGKTDPSLQTVLYIVDGLMHLKSELNYSLALECFLEGCRWAESGDDPNNHIVLLANIAHIFYVRQDPHGLQYAREAYAISHRPEVAPFPRCQANLLMGQMLLLADSSYKAEKYLDTAGKMIEDGDFLSLKSIYYLLYAKLYQNSHQYNEAEQSYIQAMQWGKYAEASIATMTYMDYGQFCQYRGRISQALDLYRKGLDISTGHRSLEFRSELLSLTSDAYRLLGDKLSAAEYSYLFKAYMDSIAGLQKEQEFNSRLLQYSQMEHEHELQTKELALLKARRKTTTAVFISAVIIILALSLYIMYLKQKKMNRILVQRYENYIQRTLPPASENGTHSEEADDSAEKSLFRRIEGLMQKEKIYRQKDLSMDRLAEMLSTNRTYVSKAINTCASQSFFSYIDQYRIREAVSMLSSQSDSSATMPFKQIADMVGYNSVQVFYRSFKKETGCSPGQYKEEARRIRRQRGNSEE